MRSTYKRFVWQAPRPVNTVDCINEWRYFLKCNKNISILTHFQQYLHSFIQSAMFTGRVARQTNRLYVLRMIVKLAYIYLSTLISLYLPTGLINKGWYGMFFACGIWCVADVSSVSPSSEQTEELWGNSVIKLCGSKSQVLPLVEISSI